MRRSSTSGNIVGYTTVEQERVLSWRSEESAQYPDREQAEIESAQPERRESRDREHYGLGTLALNCSLSGHRVLGTLFVEKPLEREAPEGFCDPAGSLSYDFAAAALAGVSFGGMPMIFTPEPRATSIAKMTSAYFTSGEPFTKMIFSGRGS